MQPELLDPTAIIQDLRTTRLPGALRCYAQVESTMDLARDWLATAEPEALPLVVSADEQTAGRGRQGRRWLAPSGSAILFSLAFRPTWLAATQATTLVQFAAVALCEAVNAQGIPAALKWPNDLLVPQAPGAPTWAKGAGILLEAQSEGSQLRSAIIGIGVNISSAPPPELTRYPATSLTQAAGRSIDRIAVMQAILRRLDAWYVQLEAGATQALYTAWRSHLQTLGQPVQIELASGTLHGIAEDVEPGGTLLVREPNGQLQRVTSGDVGLAQ